jgi:hypothetical protein
LHAGDAIHCSHRVDDFERRVAIPRTMRQEQYDAETVRASGVGVIPYPALIPDRKDPAIDRRSADAPQ